MRKRWMGRFNRTMGETGKGLGIGALAGGLAGLLLGFTRPFNRGKRPGKAAKVAGIGAAAGGAVGVLIWKMPTLSVTVRQVSSPVSDLLTRPDQWTLFREQVIELPETLEFLDVRKQARQVEAVVVHPVVTERVATTHDIVRHTELDIQRGLGPMETITGNEEGRLSDRDVPR